MIPKSGLRFSEKIMRKQIFRLISPFCDACLPRRADAGANHQGCARRDRRMIPKSGLRFSEKIMRKQIFRLISPF